MSGLHMAHIQHFFMRCFHDVYTYNYTMSLTITVYTSFFFTIAENSCTINLFTSRTEECLFEIQ